MAPFPADTWTANVPEREKRASSFNMGVASRPMQLSEWAGMTKEGRPTERRGVHGGFSHGVTYFAGGMPSPDRPAPKELDHGTVLYRSENLRPDFSYEGSFNTIGGRDDERQGRHGSFSHGIEITDGGRRRFPTDSVLDCPEPGSIGGRRGSGTHHISGVTILAGGAPRDMPAGGTKRPSGTVLHTFDNLRPDLSQGCQVNERGERVGSKGGFQPGPSPLRYPARDMPQKWVEPGQTGARRFSGNHWNAGVTIGAGGQAKYDLTQIVSPSA